MWHTAAASWLLVLATAFVPERPAWEIVRSEDADFAFSMPAKAVPKAADDQGATGTQESLTYSCLYGGSLYFIQRFRFAQPVGPGQVIAQLADLRKRYVSENAKLVKETKIVADGVIGDDFTYTAASSQSDGNVTKRTRHFLTGHFYYVLTVTSPPGKPLPEDATRFLSSLTFEALVKAHYARMKSGPKSAAKPQGAAKPKGYSPALPTKVELTDSTPEDALKTFILALAAQDETTLRAITVPDQEFDWLLKGRSVSPDQLAQIRARLAEIPMKRLKAGDPVRMPDGESRVIKPADVDQGRVVLWPEGAPMPSRVENVGGHWKVFARPLIIARKLAETQRKAVPPNSVGAPRAPGR